MKETNISAWRRQTFGDLTAVFRFDTPKAHAPALLDAQAALAAVHEETARLPKPTLPGTNQTVPTQEKGKRKRLG